MPCWSLFWNWFQLVCLRHVRAKIDFRIWFKFFFFGSVLSGPVIWNFIFFSLFRRWKRICQSDRSLLGMTAVVATVSIRGGRAGGCKVVICYRCCPSCVGRARAYCRCCTIFFDPLCNFKLYRLFSLLLFLIWFPLAADSSVWRWDHNDEQPLLLNFDHHDDRFVNRRLKQRLETPGKSNKLLSPLFLRQDDWARVLIRVKCFIDCKLDCV